VDLIRARVRRQAWLPLYPGVYTILTGPPGRSARLWAAVLYSGSGALLSHETAAELHGLADAPSNPIYVTVPGQRRVIPAEGISIYRSARALEAAQGRTYPPRTRVEETVLDLTQAAATFDDVCGWVTTAFARDLTDDARLRKAMSARPKLRWRADLDELITAAAGGDHSVLEYRYDKARDNAAVVAGMQTLRYGWTQVRREPCEIAIEVAMVLRLHGWPSRPRACSPGCPAPQAIP
jgi:hypothetical protein